MAIAASRLTRHYCASLISIAHAGLAHGVGLDLSPQRCRVLFRKPWLAIAVDLSADDIVRCAERPTTWPVAGRSLDTLAELREYVWSRLFGAHVGPVFTRMVEVVPGSGEALLWTNAAEYVGMVSDAAEEYLTGDAAKPYVADRRALLDAADLPGVRGPNPLRDKIEWIPTGTGGFPEAVQTRRLCCLTYLLADRDGRLCQNCPHFSLDDRAELMRERHGVAIGGPTGPAEARAHEVGHERPSMRRRRMLEGTAR
jgi:hypothetical protein